MLKKRIVGTLIIKNGIVVQSFGFNKYLPVGKPEVAIEYLDRWGIDEIVVLDIDASQAKTSPSIEPLKKYFKHCHVPVAIGGGIKSKEDFQSLIRNGADKVVVNSILFTDPETVKWASKTYGSQCIVGSLDVKMVDGKYFVKDRINNQLFEFEKYIKTVEELELGELFITSIDKDGAGKGFDLELIELATKTTRLPVIISGGAGNPSHFSEALQYDLSGVAAANFFHYFEHSVVITKTLLAAKKHSIRMDLRTRYQPEQLSDSGRVAKLDDAALSNLRFVKIEEEVI
ncbi:MAG: imidazole glycerol phosphate synthase cyclase subunit [Halobacteriovorax sp.]|nr:imidazole glycerol phosphate synthase cyclase subunit [Halobacteriovorax sp.]